MDIESLSIAMSQNSIATQVGTALLKMTMDNNAEVAQNLNEMMGKIAVDPSLGNIIDTRA